LWIAVAIEWLLAAFQLVGAVLATLSAVAIGKGLALLRMKRLLQVGFAQLVPWRSLAAIAGAAAVAGSIAVLLGPEPDMPPLLRISATSLVCTMSYAGLVLPLLEEGERLILAGRVKSWLTRAVKAYECRG
jgi:hypothetical protein